MADTYTISPANLRAIENSLEAINHNIGIVNDNISVVNDHVNKVEDKLLTLHAQFLVFLEEDRKAKQLQLAETRIVKVRQELDKKYGVHDEVRRHAVGILQASDLSMVRTDTILTRTEEMLLNAPRYWLAPCLIALAAWLGDNRQLADKALMEAIRRDGEKASLFFSLVCRRSGRVDACNQWLSKYLGLQDPTSLDREVVVLLDAFANGLLGPDTKGECSKAITNWIQELSKQPLFIDDQKHKWEVGLGSILPKSKYNYPMLTAHSSDWNQIAASLDSASSHDIFKSHFAGIMESEINLDASLVVEIDAILDKLTQEFDDEELPLRRDELRMSLIIEHEGDTNEADAVFAAQQTSLADKMNFTQLLTNAAMHPEVSHASKATQKLAIALSLDWILMAYKDMTATYQAKVPDIIHYELAGWKGETKDGKNESDQVQKLTDKFTADMNTALKAVKLAAAPLVVQICLVALAIFSRSAVTGVLAAGAILFFLLSLNKLFKQKNLVRAKYEKLIADVTAMLKACLAEVVDYRRQFQQLDSQYKSTLDYLTAIEPQQYITNSFSKARSIL